MNEFTIEETPFDPDTADLWKDAEPIDFTKLKTEELGSIMPFYAPFLKKVPEPFDFVVDRPEGAENLKKVLMEKMISVGGIGLTAPPVGIDKAVLVAGYDNFNIVLFNPVIIAESKTTIALEEACTSTPDFSLVLTRPQEVIVSYQDETGDSKVMTFSGATARVVQHCMDYLRGKNFTHLASHFKMKRELKRFQKTIEKRQRKMIQDSQRDFIKNLKEEMEAAKNRPDVEETLTPETVS